MHPDSEHYQEMKQMREIGYTFREIGEHFGVSRQRVQQILGERPQDNTVNPSPKPDCIEWEGPRDKRRDYGLVVIEGKLLRAHRYVWEQENGKIPDGMCVLHKCDNPICVNPDHLFLGTRADNNKDRKEKGRGKGGWRMKMSETGVTRSFYLDQQDIDIIDSVRAKFRLGRRGMNAALRIIIQDYAEMQQRVNLPRAAATLPEAQGEQS